jgi:peptidoglycan/xylan/chitin deacetylase (PgdA/CDA1 family)
VVARAFPAARLLIRTLDHDTLASICSALERALGEAPAAGRSLRWDELALMARAGLTVASHTATHSLLPRESVARVKQETESSRAIIEEKLGVRVVPGGSTVRRGARR